MLAMYTKTICHIYHKVLDNCTIISRLSDKLKEYFSGQQKFANNVSISTSL